ncbi:MAG: phosphate/phosphite/phosphonate ABC transporter substrate-binding protein [Candidatus Thermoplasmatota archaeon]|nr:phosphate/phosphite/phosphonate ABC transporter substrate-binding protein [Candidatus Thermoplasmatota archaeon]
MRLSALRLGLPSLIPYAPAQAAGLRRTQRSRLAALFGCLLLIAGRPVSGADAPLVFGVFPHLTAKQIVETYRPIADTLEKHLQRGVVIYSARDFKTFIERTRQGEYDILLTAPHLAWLARQDAGYRPLLKYAQPVYGLLAVRADSPFDEPGALRGRTIAIPDPFAVVVLALHAELAAKVQVGRPVRMPAADCGPPRFRRGRTAGLRRVPPLDRQADRRNVPADCRHPGKTPAARRRHL